MKKVVALFVACMLLSSAQAQFQLQWQKSFGGTAEDAGSSVKPTSDGGFIMCGKTLSNNGDVTFIHTTTAYDVWVVKTDSLGNIQWQKSYGGSLDDRGFDIIQTLDGGFAFTGETLSSDGDVSGFHTGSQTDAWVVKLNSTGTIQWQKCLGGNQTERANSLYQISTGELMVGGTAGSTDGDVTGQHGNGDFWLVKLSTTGSIVWQKTYGGSEGESISAMIPANDGGYILTGRTWSNNGDVTMNHGGHDFWIVKVDASGTLVWQRTYGGTADEALEPSISSTNTLDGYIFCGPTYSVNGDVTGNHGNTDVWVLRINNTGSIVWQKCFGSTGADGGTSVRKTTGGYVVFAKALSNGGDVTGLQGSWDWWVFKLTEGGSFVWRKALGSAFEESSAQLAALPNNRFAAIGYNSGNGGDVTGNHGNKDYWLAKFYAGNALLNPTFSVSNTSLCCKATIDMSVSGGTPPYAYLWSNGATTQDLLNMCTGTYVVTVTDAGNLITVDTAIVVTANGPNIISTSIVSPVCSYGNGSIDITVSGNITPFSYTWSNGASTQDLTNVPVGAYTVTVFGNGGCSTTKSFSVLNTAVSSVLSWYATPASCGLSNGSVTVVGIGGVSPFTFLWSNGATTQNLTAKPAGYYALTVTNASGCTSVTPVVVTNANAPAVTNVNTSPTCGLNNGSINISASGGTAPYSYLWSNGATTEDLTNAGAGLYVVTVTGANGCKVSSAIELTGQGVMTVNAQPYPSTCGLSNGYIVVTTNYNFGPFSYLWSTGATTQHLYNKNSGTYSVTVTHGTGCPASATATIPASTSVSNTLSTVSPSCGQSNGSITSATGGSVAPYLYSWSNGKTTQNISNLPAGTYTVSVTASNGCSVVSSATLTSTGAPVLSAAITNATCSNANGSLQLTISGGNAPFTFLWSNGKTTQNITNLSAGSYTVTVTGSNGCNATLTASVSTTSGLTLTLTPQAATCGSANGSVTLAVSGGTSPYTFLWSNGKTTQNITSINAGTYSVTVTSANGCSSTGSAVVTSPNSPTVSLTPTNPSCGSSNGSITSVVTGGVSPFTFLWSSGKTTSSITALPAGTYSVTVTGSNGCNTTQSATLTGSPVISFSTTNPSCSVNGSINATITNGLAPYTFLWSNGKTTEDISNLSAGTFTLTVTGANGCSSSQTATLSSTTTAPTATTLITDAACGTTNGSIDLTVSGGTSPYTYSWSNGKTTQDITNLAAGSYTVTVTGANGCTTYAYAYVGALNLSVVAIATDATCNNNGSIAVTVSGGTAPYTFLWSNGATTQNLSNLAPGTYTVTVTSSSGCTGYKSRTVYNSGANIYISSSTNPYCSQANGYIQAYSYYGTQPYSFLWSNGLTTSAISNLLPGTYSVTLTDANGCTAMTSQVLTNVPLPVNISYSNSITATLCQNSPLTLTASATGAASYLWSNGQTSASILVSTYGTYSVTVTNANGCTGSKSTTVSIVNSTTQSIVGAATLCNGNSTTLSLYGYSYPSSTYIWSTGATTNSVNVNTIGTYSVTATSVGGCTLSGSKTITAGSPPNIVLDALTDAGMCGTYNGNDTVPGSISIYVNDAVYQGPYTFEWSSNAILGWEDGYINGYPGTYSVTVTSAGGCTSTASYTIGMNINDPFYVDFWTGDAECGFDNGYIEAYVQGGIPPYYYYAVDDNGNWIEFNGTLDSLPPGNYYVNVSDGTGCQQSYQAYIQSYVNFGIYLNTITKATCGLNNGIIDIDVYDYSWTGLTFTYDWSNGTTTQDLTNANPNEWYSVIVTDNNGCTLSEFFDPIGSIAPPQVTIAAGTLSCNPMNIQFVANGTLGTTPYSYTWSNGSTSQSITGPGYLTYTVTMTDASGCTATKSITLYNTPPMIVTMTGDLTLCPGQFTSLGTSGSYSSYLWSTGATTSTITTSTIGTYTVTVTNANGCTGVGTSTLTQNILPQFWVTAAAQPSCGQNNGTVYFNYTSGSTPFTFAWSNGKTTEDLYNLGAGTYTLTLTDAQGCTATTGITLTAAPGLALTYTVNKTYCNSNNGSITIFATGGTWPYTYTWSNSKTTQSITSLSAGTYTVTVNSASGCSATTSVIVTSSPNLTVEAVGYAPTCTGTNGYAYANGVTGGTSPYSYSWSNGKTTYANYNLTPGIYTVTVTSANGCTGSDTALVKPYVPHTVSITPSGASICAGQSITLQGTGSVSYYWSPISGLSASTGATVSATPTVTTTYVLTGYFISCPAYDTIVVTVNPLPNTVVSASQSSVCNGGSSTLTASGASTYYWTPSTGLSSTSNAVVLASPSASTTYTVVGVSNAGCFKTATVSLTAGTAPVLTKSITHTTCGLANGAVNLTVSGGSIPYTFLWSNGATTEDLINKTAFTYSVTVTGANGCTASTSATINSSSGITINSTSTAAGCGQTNGAVTLTVSGALAPYTYAWSNGKTTQNISNLAPGTYTVTVTSANGCTKTKATIVNTSTSCPIPTGVTLANVTNNSAKVSWTGNMCAVQYRVWIKATTSSTASTYLVTAPTTTYTFINLNPNTTYQVQVRTMCSTDGTIMSAYTALVSFTTTADPPCTTPTNLAAAATSNTTALLTWTAVTGSYGYNVQYKKTSALTWSTITINNGATSSQSITGLTPATSYQFKIRNKCTGSPATYSSYSSIITLTTPARLDEGIEITELRLYPNPTSGNFVIELISVQNRNALVRIYTVDGRIAFEKSVDIVTGSNSLPFDVSAFASGVYMVEVKTNDFHVLRKLVLTR